MYGITWFFFTRVEDALLVVLTVGIFLFGIAYGMSARNSHTPILGVRPIDISRYGWLVELWRTRCLRYGAIPGPVLMFEQKRSDWTMTSFGVNDLDPFRVHPVLFVGELMSPLLRPEIVLPVIEHELGHCRLLTSVLRNFFGIISEPGTFILFNFFSLRKAFEQTTPAVGRFFLFFERLSFWGSRYAFRQYEEYAADALMVQAVDDEDQVLDMLRCVSQYLAYLVGRPALVKDISMCNHPMLEQRMQAIQSLFD